MFVPIAVKCLFHSVSTVTIEVQPCSSNSLTVPAIGERTVNGVLTSGFSSSSYLPSWELGPIKVKRSAPRCTCDSNYGSFAVRMGINTTVVGKDPDY